MAEALDHTPYDLCRGDLVFDFELVGGIGALGRGLTFPALTRAAGRGDTAALARVAEVTKTYIDEPFIARS